MAIASVEGAAADGETKDLVSETNAKHRQRRIAQQLFGQGNAAADRRGITGAIGEENTIGLERQNSVGITAGREHLNVTTMGAEPFKDGALDAEIDRHNAITIGWLVLKALIKSGGCG